MASRNTLVIGIDFGTTFSGVSWVFCREGLAPGVPEVITKWPTVLTKTSDRYKVPSRIHYGEDASNLTWGYQIRLDVEPLEWFKLLLLEPADVPASLRQSPHIKNARHMLEEVDKTVAQVIGDYLRLLWTHSITIIKKAKGPSLVNGTPFHVVMTVPAIWKDYARDKMRQAAAAAGMLDERLCGETKLSFVSEPEAAALATFRDLGERGDLVSGDSFIVCDAGGGTVDIISYTVTRPDPFEVKECVEGEGKLCGGTFLDAEFLAFFKKSVGVELWDVLDPVEIKRTLYDEWEHGIKPSFDFEGSKRDWMMQMPKAYKDTHLTLQGSDIRKVFDGVTSEINKLVTDQIYAVKQKTKKPPKLVILVGGFGRSDFIYDSLKERHGSMLEILKADNDKPWHAICRGAAIYGTAAIAGGDETVQIRSRICRLSYGWKFDRPFKMGKHKEEDKKWDKKRGRWMAEKQMQWAVKKGEDVDSKEPKTYYYSKTFPLTARGVQRCSFVVYTCDSANPPSRQEDNVVPLATISYDTPQPVETLPVVRDRGPDYRRLNIEKKMDISGASLDLSVFVNGERLTDKSLDISYD